MKRLDKIAPPQVIAFFGVLAVSLAIHGHSPAELFTPPMIRLEPTVSISSLFEAFGGVFNPHSKASVKKQLIKVCSILLVKTNTVIHSLYETAFMKKYIL